VRYALPITDRLTARDHKTRCTTLHDFCDGRRSRLPYRPARPNLLFQSSSTWRNHIMQLQSSLPSSPLLLPSSKPGQTPWTKSLLTWRRSSPLPVKEAAQRRQSGCVAGVRSCRARGAVSPSHPRCPHSFVQMLLLPGRPT